ncbi:hypothetical protein [Morganella psychrotolerans]|uniref:Uncharacterized protein n=1 Tax=Morganella psychrotolerans TaxID=368603 RepID=A0A1B8HL49_9GAMM|nr:hypothetical protein [Morganella psychrotolerans]OBU09930.1 hypothetical protein AYY17_17050 [Morganella psychrotolerans]
MGVLAVIIFSLNGKVNGLIPQDILNVAREVDSASKFWAKLNGHGKNLSLSIISSAILISISIILIHISSFIELAYALANKNQTGFFFFIFKCGQKCRFKTFGVGGMVVLFIVIITLVLEGYIFNINW